VVERCTKSTNILNLYSFCLYMDNPKSIYGVRLSYFFWVLTSSDAKLVLLYEDFGPVSFSAPLPIVVLKTFCCGSYFR
jgi:hypothetical protein